MLSQALAHDYCACHWPCTDKTLHKKKVMKPADLITATLSIIPGKRHSKDEKSPWVHLSNNLAFRPPWTFLDPYKSPSSFCRGLAGHNLSTGDKPQKCVMLWLDTLYGSTVFDNKK